MGPERGGVLTLADEVFLARPALDVAPDLLGAVLSITTDAGTVGVRLTEVEAYEGLDDPASHGWRGPTPRTTVMFGPPGRLYVYFTYGMHWCANVVCGSAGHASAVLLRAGEVVSGVELAQARRPAAKRPIDLARGPARLASALGLTGADNGLVLLGSDAPGRLELPAGPPESGIATGPRVGVTRAADRPWRFWIDTDPTVSAYRPGGRRRRVGAGECAV